VKPLLSALLAAAVLSLAACGDDEDEASTTTSQPTATTAGAGATGATGDGVAKGEPCTGAGSPPNITQVTSHGIDCAAVEDAMADIGSVSAKFKLGDFTCALESGEEVSGLWRCDGEAGYFTFAFGD
jgi:predicted small lipoprotein YifL